MAEHLDKNSRHLENQLIKGECIHYPQSMQLTKNCSIDGNYIFDTCYRLTNDK